MNEPIVRKPSCNELLYDDLQDFTNTYAIQFIFQVSRIENLPLIECLENYLVRIEYGSFFPLSLVPQ